MTVPDTFIKRSRKTYKIKLRGDCWFLIISSLLHFYHQNKDIKKPNLPDSALKIASLICTKMKIDDETLKMWVKEATI